VILNRQSTAIVVDSTADLPPELEADPNVSIVPLTVYFGQDAYLDGVNLRPPEFFRKLAEAEQLPKTSQPPVGEFVQLFRRLREQYQRVYSIHVSSEMSGTFESARMAAEQVDGVKAVDSRHCTGGLALLIDRLVERLELGTPEEEFEAYIARYVKDATFLFLPTTLDYLHKGGRIGRASQLLGTMLSIKPVLSVEDGVVTPYKKARGVRQALTIMREAVVEQTSPWQDTYVGLTHALNEPLLAELRSGVLSIPDRIIHLRGTSVVGAVIGTYVGPGAVGVAFIQE